MLAFILLLQISFLFSEAFGCPSNKFRCNTGKCINKNQWCDSTYDCSNGDSSDEEYCSYPSYEECNSFKYFRCQDNYMCIPITGYCDGYVSCPDGSDEDNCPCETLYDEKGIIHRTLEVGNYFTRQMCWELNTYRRYLNLSIQAALTYRSCSVGSITVTLTPYNQSSSNPFFKGSSNENEEDIKEKVYVVCPGLIHQTFSLTGRGTVKIRYWSSWYNAEYSYADIFNITYNMVDRECLKPDSFKCSEESCISAEKVCDGNKDCENGMDEHKCVGTSSIYAISNNREILEKVINWMRIQHNSDWGWKENTARAVVALHLSDSLNFIQHPYEDDLFAKQLELEVSTHLLRNKYEKLSPTELSVYINALLVICHNPKNFFGFDLIQKLKEEIENETNFVAPLSYLTLCNARDDFLKSTEAVDGLLEILQKSSDHGFILEVQALAIMALTCISKDDRFSNVTEHITEALNKLKLEQREDGSFGNEYTTSLVLQAFIASNQSNPKDWNLKSSMEFLKRKQKSDGSFGDFLTTYLAMPIFNAKSLVDIGKVNCTKDLIRPKEGNLLYGIKSKLEGKILIKYSVFVGDKKDQIHPIFLRVPENVTALEVMVLAADVDPKYKFKTHEIKKKAYVYEILNIPNDPENNKFWFLYHDVRNETLPVSTQAPGEMHVSENDHIIMWYKTLNIL